MCVRRSAAAGGFYFDRVEGPRGNFGGLNRCVVLGWIEETS